VIGRSRRSLIPIVPSALTSGSALRVDDTPRKMLFAVLSSGVLAGNPSFAEDPQ
jgi:hypothetical protein